MLSFRSSSLLIACFVGLAFLAAGCDSGGDSTDESENEPPPSSFDVTVTLDNIQASAWEVTDVEGESGVASTGTENPTLTLTVGTRYLIVNNGGTAHPFGMRDADGDYLLNQDGNGSLEDDAAIDYDENDASVEFTYTQTLADAVTEYRCTIHGSMVGAVETR